ncbi:MAG: response regulator [Thermodesulfobacteriota bacterium]
MESPPSRFIKESLVPLHVETITSDTIRLLRATLPKNITLSQELAQQCPAVLGDAVLISQLIADLCANAAGALGAGTPGLLHVSVASGVLAGGKTPRSRHVRLSVRGNGPGSMRAFANDLSMVRDIVARLHGDLIVQNQRDAETLFEVLLPALDNTDDDLDCSLTGKEEHILLVDDDEELAVVVDRILTRQRYTVSRFNDGGEAWESFQRTPDRYDLIFTDIAMPGLNGIDLALRVSALRPGMPVIFTSGVKTAIDEIRRKNPAVSSLLQKPASKLDIIRAVRQALDRKQPPSLPPK